MHIHAHHTFTVTPTTVAASVTVTVIFLFLAVLSFTIIALFITRRRKQCNPSTVSYVSSNTVLIILCVHIDSKSEVQTAKQPQNEVCTCA